MLHISILFLAIACIRFGCTPRAFLPQSTEAEKIFPRAEPFSCLAIDQRGFSLGAKAIGQRISEQFNVFEQSETRRHSEALATSAAPARFYLKASQKRCDL